MSGQQALDALEEKQLCQLIEGSQSQAHVQGPIAKAKEKFKKEPSESQIARGRMLKRKGEILTLRDNKDDSRKRLRAAKWPAIKNPKP